MRRLLGLIALPVAVLFIAVSAPQAHAASFDAGRIIDDVIFTNNTSMSVGQIQDFLNSKVPTCDTNGTMPASDFGRSDLTHAQYAASQGWPGPPYTCLKDYVENGTSSAQLIYNLSQQYKINPQVLIVTLQKESSLVTDYWPLSSQYKTATGYGCPDSGPNNSANCDASYYGLTNQLTHTAYMYRAILNQDPNWYSPYVVGTNYIQWSPTSSCGGSNVNIQNWSTAALYDYTPYQPNSAALNAGYGMGDSCSAYGNRNFWLYFSDWFGSTEAPAYEWQSVGQTVFTDSTKTTSLGWNAQSFTGKEVYVQVKAKNIGNSTWSNSGPNPVLLGTWNPQDNMSPVCDKWVSCNRAATLIEPSVAPGETGTFEFWMKAPSPGTYSIYFNLVSEGKAWFNPTGMYITYTSTPYIYSWAPGWQQAYYDDTKSKPIGWNADVTPGQKFYFVLKAKNTGNTPWVKGQTPGMLLGTWNPQDSSSPYCTNTWIRCNRAAALDENTVNPGETGTFEFWMQAPAQTGNYSQYFNMVAEGVTWMDAGGVFLNINVKPVQYSWQPVGQSVWTDSTKTTNLGWNGKMAPGGKNYVEIYAKNTGNVPWVKNSVNPTLIGTWNPQDRSSKFYDPSWVYINRPAIQQQDIVYPGDIATYQFTVTAPSTPGTYSEYFNVVADGKTWLNPVGQYFSFNVQ